MLLGHPGKNLRKQPPNPSEIDSFWTPAPLGVSVALRGGGVDIFWNCTIALQWGLVSSNNISNTQPFEKLWQFTVIVIDEFKTPLNVIFLTYSKSSIKPLGASLFQIHLKGGYLKGWGLIQFSKREDMLGGGGFINFFARKGRAF